MDRYPGSIAYTGLTPLTPFWLESVTAAFTRQGNILTLLENLFEKVIQYNLDSLNCVLSNGTKKGRLHYVADVSIYIGLPNSWRRVKYSSSARRITVFTSPSPAATRC